MPTENVYCSANGGRRYRVVFHSGEPYAVFSLFYRGMSNDRTERKIWPRDDRRSSVAAGAAIRAARQLQQKFAAAPAIGEVQDGRPD